MTAHTLPKNPCYAFSPAYDLDNELQQIRIVIHGAATFPPPWPHGPCAPRTMHRTIRPCAEPPALLRSRPDVIWPQPRRASLLHHAIHTGRLKTIA